MSSRGNEIGGKYYKGFNVAFFLDFLLFDRFNDMVFLFLFVFFFYEPVVLKQRWIEKNVSYDEDFFFLNKILRGACYTIQPIGFDYINVEKFFFNTRFLNYESF